MRLNYIDNCDNIVGLRGLPDGCIDLTVTSPPYDNLRTYSGNVEQWCFEKFQAVAKELYRVTKKGGVVVWVVADATIKGSETGSSFKHALFFKECGFNLHDTMIFVKRNPVPQTHNRYEQAFEYMFVLSKGRPNKFNPILEPSIRAGEKNTRRTRTEFDKNQSMRVRDEVCMVKPYKRKTNVFYYGVGGKNKKHPAVYPERLARDHIVSWSNPGDVVLDPFMGSGTTAVACIKTGRNYVGFEIDAGYCDIANQRVAELERVPC